MKIRIERIADRDHGAVRRLLVLRWGSARIVRLGKMVAADRQEGFIAWTPSGRIAGLITVRLDGARCEIVTLDTIQKGNGIGTRLLTAAIAWARTRRCRIVWLVTTNDNLGALRFYQRRRFALTTLRRNALAVSRRLKPGIPMLGVHRIPIRDELVMERRLR